MSHVPCRLESPADQQFVQHCMEINNIGNNKAPYHMYFVREIQRSAIPCCDVIIFDVSVDKTERGTGHYPEQELISSGFKEYRRP